jgi:hypothetical protein
MINHIKDRAAEKDLPYSKRAKSWHKDLELNQAGNAMLSPPYLKTCKSLRCRSLRQKSRQKLQPVWSKIDRLALKTYTLAWKAGIYNPLAGLEDIQARFLESHEEDWLFLAKQVGWLQVEAELDAIYFTAPPPLFAQDQADWYLRPDLTTWLKEPEPLREVVISYPISQQLMLQAIDRHRQQLQWTAAQLDAFIWEITAKSELHLTQEDYMILLLELGLQL